MDTVRAYQEWATDKCDYYGERERLGTYGELYQGITEYHFEDDLDTVPLPEGDAMFSPTFGEDGNIEHLN